VEQHIVRRDLSPAGVAVKGRGLIAAFTDAVPTARRRRAVDGSIAARLLARLLNRPATAHEVAVIDAVLVILSDHDLASSTLAARVAASTRADPYAVVAAGLSGGAGPLHLGATMATVRLLDEVRQRGDAAAVLDAYLSRRELVPGFGHRIYRGLDPRLPLVLDAVRAVPGAADRLTVVDDVIAAAASRFDKQANIDLALGGMVHALGLARHSTDYLFAIARTVGWLAHAIEEYDERPLRFRPRAVYVGEQWRAGEQLQRPLPQRR
jgi:citrate synthase